MHDMEVIDSPAAAAAALDPLRSQILAALREPASATAVAGRVGLTRQKVNYHLTKLERHGLVTQVDERAWGGITERLFVATAVSYVVSPAAMGAVAGDPATFADRMSARYVIALAARLVREVGALVRRGDEQGKRVATLGLDTEISFAGPAERAAFTEELTAAVTALVARYHDTTAPGPRPHRLVVAAHPIPPAEPSTPPDLEPTEHPSEQETQR